MIVLVIVALLAVWAITASRQSDRIQSLESSLDLSRRAHDQLVETIGAEWQTRDELYALIEAQPTLYNH